MANVGRGFSRARQRERCQLGDDDGILRQMVNGIRESIASLEARMDRRFEQIDRRLEAVDKRFEALAVR